MAATSILIYGRSGSGKSAQIGRLAEEVYVTTGLKTRVYSADFGGNDVNAAYIDLGIIEVVEIAATDPWIFLNKAVRGQVRNDKGQWLKDEKRNATIGMYAYESAHGFAQLLRLNMNDKASTGSTIGGDTNSSFEVAGDGEKFKIGSVKGFQQYAIPQQQMLMAMYESFKLPAQYIVWSAGVDTGSDELNAQKVVGPSVIGGALTTVLTKDFNYAVRIDAVTAKGSATKHVLYLGTQPDSNASNATALGNIRRPLDANELKELTIEPADLVKALRLMREEAKEQAKLKIQARLKIASEASNQVDKVKK